MNYTKEQEQAIFLRGKNIMVSAGAGAGKTRVLVSRMAELIMDKEHPIEADHFLVMTFTNAAAAEMKERIGTELEERLEKDPDNLYLRKQIRKIRQADISTIHSFCNHLIRTHYNELAIDPSFRIGEEGELFLLRQQAVEQVLEEAYASGRESFLQFVEAYAPGKNDTVLEEMIEDLYHFSRSFPNADGWFEKTGKEAAILAGKDGWDTSAAITLLLSKAQKESLQIQEELYQILGSVTEDSPEKYTGLLQEIKEYIDSLTQAKDYNSYYKVLSQKSISSFPRASKKEKEWELYEEVKEFHQKVREQINSQKENVFTAPAEELQREAAVIYPLLEEYMALTKRFAEIYFLCKKEKNVYDFDDLEHFALELLVESYDEQGEAQPSETAKELSKKYKMIFVDEYQDTNLVQETILEMLLNKKHNSLFTVGDVKQSIYRFRQARPDLFLRRKDQYISQADAGVSIELRDNFRSAPGVLTFTNYIFSQLMEKEFGGVDYNEKTALRPGEGGPMMQDEETSEILFFQKDSASALKEVPEDILAESAVICKRIKELIEEGYHYGDMVILLRSGAGRMEPMAEFLEQEGIPVSCDNKTGYFQTREITVMLNYLSIVDNIYQDIPMASVMLSSIGKFTEEELVKLRVLIKEPVRGKYTLYDFMRLYMQEGTEEELKKKIRDFLMDLLYFRQQKKEQPLSTLLWDIYERTGFYYDVQLMPDGEKRKENLLMLLKKAEDYEKTVFKGLFYFNRYMKQLKSYEIEMGEAGTSMEEEDVVKIMTIHKSKGLEFPVVFVSGLSKKFNRMDLNKAVLCHPELGIGMECVNTTLRFHHPSLMKKAIQEKVWKDTLEEEMRILYVAMTRAKRKLILTGLIKSEELEAGMRASIQAQKWRAGSMMDWILPIMAEQFQNTDKIWLKTRLFSWSDIEDLFDGREKEEAVFSYRHFMEEYVEGQDSSLIKKAFSHVYPNMEATKWKRKYSVSELKSLSQIALPNEESIVYEPDEEERIIPQFLKEEQEEVGGAAKGTIVHKIMEMLPFAKIQTKKQLFDWITDLEQSYPESKQISAKWLYRGIEAFLFSEQGEKIRKMDEAGKVKKELPFTVGLPVSLINQDTEAEDTVVVQGVIDACADMGDHLCLIDYKTDRIKEGEEQQLLDRYGNQMLYYKAALEQILEKRVREIYLYSFSLKKFISVEKILTSISGK
nr:helicase-exonuclease AddAB subunit AddA [uncultured Anaerobutyricum sp.]